MLRLTQSLTAWKTDDFGSALKTELEACDANQLPLAKGTSQGGYIGEDNITVTVNRFSEIDSALEGSVGVFFTEVVINCGCGVDPLPINAYCELRILIDKTTAKAHIGILTD